MVYALTGRASDPAPRERAAFTASCVQVTGYALDGSTPATSTYTWDFARNQPGCGE